jgi:starch synthase (maltosyl-transferring)
MLRKHLGTNHSPGSPGSHTTADRVLNHIVIEAVTPSVDDGRYPVKRVAGKTCVVEADIFGDSTAALAAVIKWRNVLNKNVAEAPMTSIDNDRWRGEFQLTENSRYIFAIQAWTRSFASWRLYFVKKAATGLDVASDLAEGIELLEAVQQRATGEDRKTIADCVGRLRAVGVASGAIETVTMPDLGAAVDRHEERIGAVDYTSTSAVVADRRRASFGAWYEMFPRSQGAKGGRHATLREAEARLPEIRDMGFDVLYLTPIHPVGNSCRKGPNNSVSAAPDSPGSPWAIGNSAGGHTAIEPKLGTLDEFDHFVVVARSLGLEIALDLALQCSPDHPWVNEHPEWFRHRPDGSIQFAENPPKQYQDIYPINFDSPDQKGLVAELHRVVLFWIERGVKIFRVDNPHTKPISFWEWLIGVVQLKHPEVIFLAEAFTRPKVMRTLAKAGFTQSYTYFTWRNTKPELIDYFTELTQTDMVDYFRPNLFTNTPDILPLILQEGGRPAFKSRLVLAATLSPSYGIYSGYELLENDAIPGTEEYANSEKYEIKARDWNRADSIREFIGRLNAIRRDNPALQEFANLRFLATDNDQIILYTKSSPDRSNIIVVAVNLDPHHSHYCTAFVPADAVKVTPGQRFEVTDLLTGAKYNWGESNYIRLEPQVEPAHILRVEARL